MFERKQILSCTRVSSGIIKQSLNIDGQQFHQYQQNLSPQMIVHKKHRYFPIEMKVLNWDTHTHVVWIYAFH